MTNQIFADINVIYSTILTHKNDHNVATLSTLEQRMIVSDAVSRRNRCTVKQYSLPKL